MSDKKAYYHGGGGVNEPAPPGKKKYKVDKAIVVQPRFVEPFFRNYDYVDAEGVDGPAKHGPGSAYTHMDEFKSIKDFLEFRRKKLKDKYVAKDNWIEDTDANRKERVEKMKVRASLLSKIVKLAGDNNADHMLPPKEHGTKIYDWKNSLYQNVSKYKSVDQYRKKHDKKFHADDVSLLDFPIDEQVTPIVGDSGSSYVDSIPISYQENYTAEPDQDGKPESTLDFGYDLTDEEAPPGRFDSEEIDLDELERKYLRPAEPGIYGLPDGVDAPDKDADQTISTENPDYGITDSGRQMYEDKWNI